MIYGQSLQYKSPLTKVLYSTYQIFDVLMHVVSRLMKFESCRVQGADLLAEKAQEISNYRPLVAVRTTKVGDKIINNAFYACTERNNLNNLTDLTEYKPLVSISTKQVDDQILISIKDNGPGIPDELKTKFSSPFLRRSRRVRVLGWD